MAWQQGIRGLAMACQHVAWQQGAMGLAVAWQGGPWLGSKGSVGLAIAWQHRLAARGLGPDSGLEARGQEPGNDLGAGSQWQWPRSTEPRAWQLSGSQGARA